VDTGTPAPAPAAAAAPPQIRRISYEPRIVTVEADLNAVVEYNDPDTQLAALNLDYRWSEDGKSMVGEKSDRLKRTLLKKGREYKITVKISDGENEIEKEGPAIKVQNASPSFVADPRELGQVDGFRVEATDPDGDALSYSLQGAPSGMTIEPSSGVLHYKGSEDEKGGDYTITVVVADGDGGSANWKFGISVSPGSKAARAAKEAQQAGKAARP
jgi:hypothetical protein